MDPVTKLHSFLNENHKELYQGEFHLGTYEVACFVVTHWSRIKRLVEDDIRLAGQKNRSAKKGR
jgi:hypothetical protein